MRLELSACCSSPCSLTASLGAQAPARDDWPQWRGPARTGVLTLDEAPAMWPPELKKGWSVEVGEGYSSPVSGDGRVFVHARRDPDEVVSAIDLATGTVAWQQKYAAPDARRTRTRRRWPRARIRRRSSPTDGSTRSARPRSSRRGTRRRARSSGAGTSRRASTRRSSSAARPCHRCRPRAGIIVHVGDDRGGSIARARPGNRQGPMDDGRSRPGLCVADRS